MPEIPDVNPGEIISSGEFGNPVLNRIIQRYTDATARDAAVPLPQAGQVVWLDDPGTFEGYDGTQWLRLDVLLGGPFLKLAGTDADPEGPMTGRQQFVTASGVDLQFTRSDGSGASTAIGNLTGDREGLAIRLAADGSNFTSRVVVRFSFPLAPTGTQPGTPIEIGPALEAVASSIVTNKGLAVLVASPTDDSLADIILGGLGPGQGSSILLRSYNSAGTAINNRGSIEYTPSATTGIRIATRATISGTVSSDASWDAYTGPIELGGSARQIGARAATSSALLEPEPPAAAILSTDPIVSGLSSVVPVRRTFTPEAIADTDPRQGVAHPMIVLEELESAVPEAVDTFPDGSKTLNRPIYEAALLAYVRSLEARIEALEAGP